MRPALPGDPTMERSLLVALTVLLSPALLTAQSSEPDTEQSENEDLPLTAARTVDIDLTEGTWISLDVSPDGGTIVFDYLGDLFTIPI